MHIGLAAAKILRPARWLTVFLLVGWLLQPGSAEAQRVQLELILAVDASLSVSNDEYYLQIDGIAEAFQSEAVIKAIEASGDHGIAVALILWSDRWQQTIAIDWTHVTDADSAIALGRSIGALPRFFEGEGTALTKALEFSIPLFWANRFEGDRLVIDVSGDGGDNRGPNPAETRNLAAAVGITINGLAILNEDSHLDAYYARDVIGGTGAFVMTAANYDDFKQAIRLKLIREIAAVPVAQQIFPRALQTAEKSIITGLNND